jgi:hypothetical protein
LAFSGFASIGIASRLLPYISEIGSFGLIGLPQWAQGIASGLTASFGSADEARYGFGPCDTGFSSETLRSFRSLRRRCVKKMCDVKKLTTQIKTNQPVELI